jgi:hypothetical protein
MYAEKEGDPKNTVKYWLSQRSRSKAFLRAYRETADRIVARYENESNTAIESAGIAKSGQSNILWSNTKLEKPALYSRTPKVVSKVRFGRQNPVAKQASKLIQRATAFQLEDTDDFDSTINKVIQDLQLTGQGVCRVRYVPVFGENQITLSVEALQNPDGSVAYVTSDGEEVPTEMIYQDKLGNLLADKVIPDVITEKIEFDYISYKDFNRSPAASWKETDWISFDNYLSRKEVIERFGKDVANKLKFSKVDSLDSNLAMTAKVSADSDSSIASGKALVIEVWDKAENRVLFMCPEYPDDFLKIEEPYKKIEGFFPCAEPLTNNATNRAFIGRPDFVYYEGHVNQLDAITAKRYLFLDALRVAGVFDKAFPELANIFKGNLNRLIPIDWARFSESSGFSGVFQLVPLAEIINIISSLFQAEQTITQNIYQISGVSDIVRGSSDPRETATAQQIKGQFATLRLNDKQTNIQRFCKNTIKIAAELIAETFQPESILDLAEAEEDSQEDQSVNQAALTLLKQEGLRRIKLDIETDSTIAIDESLQKEQIGEYITGVTGLIQQSLPFVQQFPEFLPYISELLSHSSHAYRFGANVESSLNLAIQSLQEKLNAPPPEAQEQAPDPRLMIADRKLSIEEQKVMQAAEKARADYEIQLAKLQQSSNQSQAEIAIEAEKIRQEWDIARVEQQNKSNIATIKAVSK